jgi:precorrin-2 dehydrogenase / sirohydrochlorin ferrochelatase
MKKQITAYYPLFLDVNRRRCLVIGGGMVALRKVKALLDFGALVEVISPRLCAGLKQLLDENRIIVLKRKFQPGDLKGAFIAIAATAGTRTNAEISSEGRRQKALVNAVDDPAHCDFILPSYFRRGGITLAISTSGMSPALARKIRSHLEKEIGKEYETLAVISEEARQELKRDRIKVNRSRWQEALDLDRLTALIRNGRRAEAKSLLLRNLKKAGEQAHK